MRNVLQESEAKGGKGFNKREMVSSVERSTAVRRVGPEKNARKFGNGYRWSFGKAGFSGEDMCGRGAEE